MEYIIEVLRVIGIPAVVGFAIWCIRLESKVKENSATISTINGTIKENNSDINRLLERLTDNISILTTASTKHDIMLIDVKDNISRLRDDIKTRPCISHNENIRGKEID